MSRSIDVTRPRYVLIAKECLDCFGANLDVTRSFSSFAYRCRDCGRTWEEKIESGGIVPLMRTGVPEHENTDSSRYFPPAPRIE